jgi:NACalpha-BTF3-like transcription factor
MSDKDISLIMSMVGCSKEHAEEYLKETNGDVLLAICNHTACPEVSGNKYIPPPPKIDDGLTEEVRAKLTEARKLSEAFSASFRNDLRGAQAQKPDEEPQVQAVSIQQEQGQHSQKPEEQVQIDVGEYS